MTTRNNEEAKGQFIVDMLDEHLLINDIASERQRLDILAAIEKNESIAALFAMKTESVSSQLLTALRIKASQHAVKFLKEADPNHISIYAFTIQ